MLGSDAAFVRARGAAAFDGFAEALESAGEFIGEKKRGRAAGVGGGCAIEKNGGFFREGVLIAGLGEEALHCHVIAEDARAAFGGAATFRDDCGGCGARGEMCEYF